MSKYLPFPYWDESNSCVKSGTFFDVPDTCRRKDIKKCKAHYNSIKKSPGFHKCHCGLSSYSSGIQNESIVTGIRVAGHYDNKKIKLVSTYLPTIPINVVLSSLKKIRDKKLAQDTLKFDKDLANFCLHEIRKYNLVIKRTSEEYESTRSVALPDVSKMMKTIFASSTSISNRLNMYDIESNPSIVTSASVFSGSVYKKFQKASHCLEIYASDNRIRVLPFKGRMTSVIDMYSVFEFVPHVILENAIKYSPPNQDVEVEFDDQGTSFSVTVSSIGPMVNSCDLSRLFEKHFRGRYAEQADSSGGGYGLYFARMICDIHDMDIEAKSGHEIMKYNGTPYASFNITTSKKA